MTLLGQSGYQDNIVERHRSEKSKSALAVKKVDAIIISVSRTFISLNV